MECGLVKHHNTITGKNWLYNFWRGERAKMSSRRPMKNINNKEIKKISGQSIREKAYPASTKE